MKDYNIKTLLLMFQIIWPIIPSVGALVGAYRGYVHENMYQTQKLMNVQREMHDLQLQVKNLIIYNSTYKLQMKGLVDGVDTNTNKISITDDYQQTLRKEVKELSEQKLNVNEFWHYVELFKSIKERRCSHD